MKNVRTALTLAVVWLSAARVQAQHLWWDLDSQRDATCLPLESSRN
jgi:hypothetical protein